MDKDLDNVSHELSLYQALLVFEASGKMAVARAVGMLLACAAIAAAWTGPSVWTCSSADGGVQSKVTLQPGEAGFMAAWGAETAMLRIDGSYLLASTGEGDPVSGRVAMDGTAHTATITWAAHVLCGPSWTLAPLTEPYAPLGGGDYDGQPVPWSPDPLSNYVWTPDVNQTELQVFFDSAAAIYSVTPASAFNGTASLVGRLGGSLVNVHGPGTLVVDFGFECAGWLEMQTSATPADLALTMSISEVRSVWLLSCMWSVCM